MYRGIIFTRTPLCWLRAKNLHSHTPQIHILNSLWVPICLLAASLDFFCAFISISRNRHWIRYSMKVGTTCVGSCKVEEKQFCSLWVYIHGWGQLLTKASHRPTQKITTRISAQQKRHRAAAETTCCSSHVLEILSHFFHTSLWWAFIPKASTCIFAFKIMFSQPALTLPASTENHWKF